MSPSEAKALVLNRGKKIPTDDQCVSYHLPASPNITPTLMCLFLVDAFQRDRFLDMGGYVRLCEFIKCHFRLSCGMMWYGMLFCFSWFKGVRHVFEPDNELWLTVRGTAFSCIIHQNIWSTVGQHQTLPSPFDSNTRQQITGWWMFTNRKIQSPSAQPVSQAHWLFNCLTYQSFGQLGRRLLHVRREVPVAMCGCISPFL